MKSLNYLKQKPHLIILIIILLIAFFFRTYKVIERFEFAHDGDLYSWIAKDIVVDSHLRLIGQLTSAPGIFIGPFFYYLNIPFFLLFNMDPIGTIIPITIIGMLTVLSYYFVFSKLFNIPVGLIAAFLYTVLLTNISFDRRVIPSTPTNLWVVWYFYAILMISKRNYFVLPILGILIGLIWHIHIALIPTLTAVPVAFLISKKIPSKNQVLKFLIALFITSTPLIVFEVRHGFSQTFSLFNNFSSEHGGGSGLSKLFNVLNMIAKNINSLFLSPQSLPEQFRSIFVLLLFVSTLFISFKSKLLSKNDVIIFLCWIWGVIGFFTLSSSLISEYYFYSIEIIFIVLTSLTFYTIYKKFAIGRFLVLLLLAIILLKNLQFYTTAYIYHKGYLEKKAVVDYIMSDAQSKNYPCFSLTYITAPGENVGFRYLFYLRNAHIVKYSAGTPVYNIVIPDEFSKEVKIKFGHIGVFPSTDIKAADDLSGICSKENVNLKDSMFGFVK